MSTKTKWKITAALSFVALAVLLPEVVSAGWHVVHGRSFEFRTWKVTVPFEWYAVRHGEGMSVQRMSRLSWQKGPVATFLPIHFGEAYHFDYDVFGSVQAKFLRAHGYLLPTQQSIRIGGQEGRCWTFILAAQRDREWINCVSPAALTSVDYIGPLAYTNEFFAVVGNIQHVPPAP
ncbi:MAG TPA: hypothetical protein VGU63_05905 [Candidatus Acidoferrales bacterium]|nr:hypothetical protein [Candidatus Acidoferrales bacterium]